MPRAQIRPVQHIDKKPHLQNTPSPFKRLHPSRLHLSLYIARLFFFIRKLHLNLSSSLLVKMGPGTRVIYGTKVCF